MTFVSEFLWGYFYTQPTVPQLILIFILFLSLSLYQLRKFDARKLPPGPTGIPIVGYIPFLGAEPHKTFLKLSERYGSKIISLRLGRQLTVVLNDYETTRKTLSHPASLDRDPKLFAHIPEMGFTVNNGEEWEEQRRYCMRSARDLGLGKGSWEPLLQEEVGDFIEFLKSAGGKPVDMFKMLSCAISNSVMALIIGRRMEKGIEDDKIQLYLDFTEVALTFTSPSSPTTIIPKLKKFCEYFKIGDYDRAAKTILEFRSFIREEMDKHKTLPENAYISDFIREYLYKMDFENARNVKHFFSDSNLEGNATTLFLGASDTVFSSLGWLFALMAHFTDVQKKVQKELDSVIGRYGTVSFHERFKIPYTFAAMMETLRYSSNMTLGPTRRAITDFEVDGYVIPKGAAIVANLWAIHNDSTYWKEPEKFIPERFLDESGTKLFRKPPAFVSFTLGRRNCPGEAIAWMEILSFFAPVLQTFNVSPPPGEKVKFDVNYGLVSQLKPEKLCFTERE